MVDTFYHYLTCFLLQKCIFIFKINTKVRWWIIQSTMVDTGIHKIHLFHTYDLHFYFSTNTKARWWILKSTKQVKCWIRCIYHCTKHQPQKRERGTVESHSVHFHQIKNDWSVPSLAYKYGLHCCDINAINHERSNFYSYWTSWSTNGKCLLVIYESFYWTTLFWSFI